MEFSPLLQASLPAAGSPENRRVAPEWGQGESGGPDLLALVAHAL
jgi:hypothetical protein